MREDNDVKYADVVSGGQGMTMMVCITGGPSALIQAPMMILTNTNRTSYPIMQVPDNLPGVCYYRLGPKGWNERPCFHSSLVNLVLTRVTHMGERR